MDNNIGSILWTDQYLKFDFGVNHIYRSDKYQMFIDQIKENEEKLGYSISIIENMIEEDAIKSEVKKSHYDRLVEFSNTGKGYIDEGSTPAFKGILDIIRYYCQGTYMGLKYLLDDEFTYAYNCLGGRHHAGPDKSGGSSYINDMGVSIPKLRREGYQEKFAIVDLDYHPGDGTLMHFGGDNTVFTGSIHDSGWGSDPTNTGWGDGVGTHIDIDITEETTGEEYVELIEDQLLQKVAEFNPDIILYVNGVDGHINDDVSSNYPIRNYSLEDEQYAEAAHLLASFAKKYCNGKILGLGAGGYNAKTTSNVWFETVKIFDEILTS